jgi:hypothetical protein
VPRKHSSGRFILLIHVIDHPHIAALGRSSDGSRFVDFDDDPGATPIPGVLIQRFEAELICDPCTTPSPRSGSLIIARAKSNVRSRCVATVSWTSSARPTSRRPSSAPRAPRAGPTLSGQLTSAPNASVGGPTASGGVTRIRGMTDW